MTTKQSAASSAASEGQVMRGSTLTPDVLQAAVVAGKVSARAVAPGAKKPGRPAAKRHEEDLDKLAPVDGEQDLGEQALAGGERGSDALLHRVSMVEAGADSGASAGENNADGGDGADAAPVAAASAAASAGGGIGALPFVLGGLVAVGGGVAESSGMAKRPASVQGVVIDAKALRFAATSSD
jgi:hypothetical protein